MGGMDGMDGMVNFNVYGWENGRKGRNPRGLLPSFIQNRQKSQKKK